MAQSEPIDIEEDQDVVGILCGMFTSPELRALASNVGVSRERGDTKGETAQKLVAQDPAVAARILENDSEVDTNCGPFKESREVGAEKISIDEAIVRARHKKMYYKLRNVKTALAGTFGYKAEVTWEFGGKATEDGYEPGLTSISIRADNDVFEGVNPLLRGSAHIILSAHGRCTHFSIDSGSRSSERINRNTGQPSRKWKVALKSIEGFYSPDK